MRLLIVIRNQCIEYYAFEIHFSNSSQHLCVQTGSFIIDLVENTVQMTLIPSIHHQISMNLCSLQNWSTYTKLNKRHFHSNTILKYIPNLLYIQTVICSLNNRTHVSLSISFPSVHKHKAQRWYCNVDMECVTVTESEQYSAVLVWEDILCMKTLCYAPVISVYGS